MFIRLKKIKGQQYAYKVKNIWRKRKKASRQKVTKYLGRVFSFKPIYSARFEDFVNKQDIDKYINEKTYREIVKDLFQYELFKHGFKLKGRTWYKGKIKANIDDKKLTKNKRRCVLGLNEGFLCTETIRETLTFRGEGIEQAMGLQMAKIFLGAGIKLEPALFVRIFEKINKQPFSLDPRTDID